MNIIRATELTANTSGNAIAIAKENEKVDKDDFSFLVFKFLNLKGKVVFRVFTSVIIDNIHYYLDKYKRIVFKYKDMSSMFHHRPDKEDVLKELI